ncbi:MAG: GGDEF domain-containing protein [Desulfocurvibacter africanus]
MGVGAPLGWLVISAATGFSQHADSTYHYALMAYMLLGTMLSFGLFGWYAGRKEDHLAQLSVMDHLTGTYNTRFFHRALEREFSNYARYGLPMSLVVLDLDHFKNINDTYGHQAGDAVLIEVAKTIRGMVRQGDTVARVGGEEFAVIMPGTICDNALAVSERIRESIKSQPTHALDGTAITVSASLGVAGTDKICPRSATDFFARVDRALYGAKEQGRDRSVVAVETGPLAGSYSAISSDISSEGSTKS